MSQVLQKLRDVDPNDSDAVKEVITSFFQTLPKNTDLNCNVWLRVLEDVITRFPRYCSQHRPAIENYLAKFLHASNYNNVIMAAKCAHGLQQIRPTQDKTATPKNCWREQMGLLCSAAHTLIEAVFSKTIHIYNNNHTLKKKDAQLLANTPLTTALSKILDVKKSQGSSGEDRKIVLCNKLRNIFVFIQAMLVEVYPVPKPIQPEIILEVILQALSVSNNVTDAAEGVPVKLHALRTLDALISCLGSNLIPFSPLVFRFVMQSLRWSSDNSNDESSKVRIASYNGLSKWLSSLHVHRLGRDGTGRCWEDELTDHVIEDITPARKIVQLTMSTQYTKNLSKKARRKLANTMLKQSAIATHMPGEKNKENLSEETSDEVANAALECAETFLTVSGIFLKPTTHKMFQERLVRECYNIDTYSVERSISLLRTLDAARKNTPSTVPPPTQYCVQLYSTLVNSRCVEIRKFCSQALLDIRLHLHCSPPSLNFALEAQQGTATAKGNRKEMSKKNRDALESLLGKNKIPPEIVDEESACASGEPLNKRPRLEETPDRISISSESEGSVVISDESDDDEVQEIVEQDKGKEVHEEEIDVLPEQQEIVAQNLTTTGNDRNTEVVSVETAEDKENSIDTTDCEQNNGQAKTTLTQKAANIYEAKTQVPLNTSNDTVDGDQSPVSMEIAYDNTNTEGIVPVLEKTDDENLPSTNDTDDVQINCGQVTECSQELEPKTDNVEVVLEISTAPTNGNIECVENENSQVISNIIENDDRNERSENIKINLTVEDMLADFVDEVNEESPLIV